MQGRLMVAKTKNNAIIEKIEENLSIRFLKKKMKKLNSDLGFMSGYVGKLRFKINDNLRSCSFSGINTKNDILATENPSKLKTSQGRVIT